jgi:hypothetical protein
MDKSDVEHAKSKGNVNTKVGDVLWRSPRRIGPCGSEHSHWGGNLLTVEEADAKLIAAAPDLLEALMALADVAERKGIPCDAARAVISKAEGGGS